MVVVIVLGSYLLGAVPAGLLIGKIGYGIDVREFGSGNIGFTNSRRALGLAGGLLVFGADIFKGALAVAGGAFLLTKNFAVPVAPDKYQAWAIVLAALAVLLGNMFSVFLGGKGGKGVGHAIGALSVMTPGIVAILFIVWLIVRAVTRYVSAASIAIALLFPVLMWFFYGSIPAYVVFSLLTAALVVFSHRTNIRRLIAGNEIKIGEGVK